jgi:uncharacterized RDD family membrane protein YckC
MQFHPRDLSELDELTEEHLGFSALSEGLGFGKKTNSAKAGMPGLDQRDSEQEDRAKKMALSGAGAVAAGPARFVAAPLRTTRAEPSVATSILQQPSAPQPLRIGAFIVDAAIVLIPLMACWRISFGSASWEIFRADRASPIFLYSVILAGYFLLSESFGGQSLGKMLLNLRVVEDDKYQKPVGLKESALRLLLLVIGTALAGAGLIASFRDPKRRAWHDRYTGSIVRPKP